MGNVLSEESEPTFLEEGFNLDSPLADKEINYGTAAPVWQNKKSSDAEVESLNKDDGNDVAALKDKLIQSLTEEPLKDQPLANGEKSEKFASKDDQDSNISESVNSVGCQDNQKKQVRQNSTNSNTSNDSQSQKKMSYVQMVKMGYQELVNAIIRPPRCDYRMEALGPPAFLFCGKRFTRTDFTLRTKRGYNLECSHWEPVQRATDRLPVIIYMHGNSSARLEVIPQLSYLLSLGLAVFAFDFAGSGKSDGEYVSLGYFEREDLSCVVAHLRATNVVSTIALWGRSMGAATALMFGDRDPSIACMILDSPFADLTLLCEEMVEKARAQGIVVPGLVVSVALRMLQSSVKKQAGFNIKQISPISHADKCFIPALFVAGEHDEFIQKHHSEALHAKYAGDKNLIIVEGDHNSPRPKFMFDSASIFLQTCLQIPNEWALEVPISMNLMCPPWYYELYEQRSIRRRTQQVNKVNSIGGSSQQQISVGTPDLKTQQVVAGFDHEEMGMTAERQRVIQASLFKMLGQADDFSEECSSGASKSKRTGTM